MKAIGIIDSKISELQMAIGTIQQELAKLKTEAINAEDSKIE